MKVLQYNCIYIKKTNNSKNKMVRAIKYQGTGFMPMFYFEAVEHIKDIGLKYDRKLFSGICNLIKTWVLVFA